MKKIILIILLILQSITMNVHAQGSIDSRIEDIINSITDSTAPKILKSLDQTPEFPGGEEALMKYLRTKTKYPYGCIRKKITGRVMVNFIVNEDGSVSDIKVVQSPCTHYAQIETTYLSKKEKRYLGDILYFCPFLEEEAMRVVRKMPTWTPGKFQGKVVKVNYNLSIVFQLR